MKNNMREVVFKKVALNGGWRSHNSVIMLKVDHVNHTVNFTQLGDMAHRNIDFTALVRLLSTDKDIRKEFRWVNKEYKRVFPASVDFYKGVSGCRQWTVNVHSYRGFEDVLWDKVATLYVSAGDCACNFYTRARTSDWRNDLGIFSGDLKLIVDSWFQSDTYGVVGNKGMVKYLKFHKPEGPGKNTTRMWVDQETGELAR
ncbi:MAG: hypothetical protein K6A45_01630 [Lachnospiraceae bacterium]|nr:hypothetical protein [Lachnospiraceae bacterium]